MILIYAAIAVLLFILMLLYFRVADTYNIIDKPNQRSSHTTVTIRGGGIIFPLAMICFFFYKGFASNEYLLLLAGMLAISLVSFWDDVSSLPNKIRLLVHLLSVTLLLYAVQAFSLMPLWAVVLTYVVIIGVINAYNFMDGINGITGVYSLVILLSCLYFNRNIQEVTEDAYLVIPVVACLVFLFFNFRKKARCFAGDVGSVSIGFWVISVLLLMILATGDLKYVLFLSVYGIDAVLTIIHRLLLRQNIFEAHRLHFYQILANEKKVPHLVVSIAYGLLQLLINAFVLLTSYSFGFTFLVICLPLSLLYIVSKKSMMRTALR